jgi:23S rRNA (adenine2503-C2)-methyltransferase
VKNKIPLKGYSLKELQALFVERGEAKYRALQVFNWMYNHRVVSFDEMGNLPKSLRGKLGEDFELTTLEQTGEFDSQDGTRKLLFRTKDGNSIESVIIPDGERVTLCVSTQAGCPLDCKFCATGLLGYKKNLTAGEIFDQFLLSSRVSSVAITNMVYMGMGEPFLNYDETVKSLEIFSDELTKGISLKKITVSTSGIPKRIRQFADTKLKAKLAFSLHSCFEDIRTELMPINKKYPLKENLDALAYYSSRTENRITYEYIMLRQINDRKEDAAALIKLCRRMPSKVNLIPFNPLDFMKPDGISARLQPTALDKIELFANTLREANITVMVRDTKGQDIAAACGQLAARQRNA